MRGSEHLRHSIKVVDQFKKSASHTQLMKLDQEGGNPMGNWHNDLHQVNINIPATQSTKHVNLNPKP
jgi:hypothetical protein